MSTAEKAHLTRIGVRYHESDQMGVVHHAVYVHYFEVGRTEMMRAHGLDYAEIERSGVCLAVVDAALTFHAPARFGDQVVVETRLTGVERVRLRFEYRVVLEGGDRLLCTGSTTLACLGTDLRPRRLPQELRRRMQEVSISPSDQ